MAQGLLELTDQEFKTSVSEGVTLVDFWAPWCGPCKMQTPILESLAGKLSDGQKIAKVNVDENPATAQEYGVQSIPTLILLKDGQEVTRFVGVQQEGALADAIASA